MTESYMPASKLARYYGNIADSIGDISHMPLNFNLISDFESTGSLTAQSVRNLFSTSFFLNNSNFT